MESIGPQDDFVPSGDDEARHEPELVTEGNDPVLNRADGSRVMALDGRSTDDANDDF
jgi:hypothetical protein